MSKRHEGLRWRTVAERRVQPDRVVVTPAVLDQHLALELLVEGLAVGVFQEGRPDEPGALPEISVIFDVIAGSGLAVSCCLLAACANAPPPL